MQNNFTYIILNNSTISITFESKINGSNIGIYGNQIIIEKYSLISAQGMGCSLNKGLGCGFKDETLSIYLGCTGTGGSHGGLGE